MCMEKKFVLMHFKKEYAYGEEKSTTYDIAIATNKSEIELNNLSYVIVDIKRKLDRCEDVDYFNGANFVDNWDNFDWYEKIELIVKRLAELNSFHDFEVVDYISTEICVD